MASYVIIPARLGSTRLPNKLLLTETGKALIQHTYEAARRAQKPKDVVIAADGPEIANCVREFGGRVLVTDPMLPSGTDRVAEAAKYIPDAEIIVNVQADEPEIQAATIDRLIDLLQADPAAQMATAAAPISRRRDLDDPACVKVVFDDRLRALYFSRAPIPFPRTWQDELLAQSRACYFQHIGIYAFRRAFLFQFAHLPESRYEQIERLEQLRALEAGFDIHIVKVNHAAPGIDTADDYNEFVRRHQAI